MIAAAVQCDVDGIPEGSHYTRVRPMGYASPQSMACAIISFTSRVYKAGGRIGGRSSWELRACHAQLGELTTARRFRPAILRMADDPPGAGLSSRGLSDSAGVPKQLRQVFERIDLIEFAGVDQAHEEISHRSEWLIAPSLL